MAVTTDLTKRERFLRAIRGEVVDRPPVWMMRQAGRYMPEYQAVRKNFDFLTMCRTPEASAEVSLQPLHVLDVDAVIVFNDILVPLEAMGLPVEFNDRGPEIMAPPRDAAAVEALRVPTFDEKEPVGQTLRMLRSEIGETALLGFVGAPFTMACYAIEGRMTKNLDHIKAMMVAEPELLHAVLGKITDTVVRYAELQAAAGVDAIQLFDTWGGTLSLADHRAFAHAYQRQVVERLAPLGLPITLYVKGGAPYLDMMLETGADTLSVDWTLPLSEVRRRVGGGVALQGNLDPTTLLTTPEIVRAKTQAMLEDMRGDGRFIANLGHGILPTTPVPCAKAFVDTVREWRA